MQTSSAATTEEVFSLPSLQSGSVRKRAEVVRSELGEAVIALQHYEDETEALALSQGGERARDAFMPLPKAVRNAIVTALHT